MPTIKQCVDEFVANDNYSAMEHGRAKDWLSATQCGDIDVRVLVAPKKNLTESELEQRKNVQKKTLIYIRNFFDERPEVARNLDALFAEFGLADDGKRRKEFFPFNEIYKGDEANVFLLKHLHLTPGEEQYTRADIAEHFLTSERTIGDRIREMRPSDSRSSKKVLGQSVQLEPVHGTNVPESTTHPLFLALNMVELYTLVDLLVANVDREVEGRIIQSILARVLDQTTDYALERLERIEGLDEARRPQSRFLKYKDLDRDVIFNEKEHLRATVEYEEKGETKAFTGYISRSPEHKGTLRVWERGEERYIPYGHIIKLTSTK